MDNVLNFNNSFGSSKCRLIFLKAVFILSFLYSDNVSAQDANLDRSKKSSKTIGESKDFFNKYINVPVVFNGKLLNDGLKSLYSFPVDTIRTITFVRSNFYIVDSFSISGYFMKDGLLILDTSKDSTLPCKK